MTEKILFQKISDLSYELKIKYDVLSEKFEKKFGEKPEFFARAPGRVNLIGEHIDYCGYSVLPMAIEHDIIIAASVNNDYGLTVTNFEEKYNDYKSKTKQLEINKDKLNWYDYFLSGHKGILDKFGLEYSKGLNVCVWGCVPKSAGLSSSSALVVCSALVTLHANELELSKSDLAETCAVAERYVGTLGGGMDQAISCLGQAGCAKLIDFNPLRIHNINLPDGSQFVITNSCVEANKAATNQFNTRVAECRIASQVLAKSQGLDWRKIKKPIDLQKALNFSLIELMELTKSVLHQDVYTIDEVCLILETTQQELILNSLTKNTSNLKEFQLYKRVMHVFSEAQRVYKFRDACKLESAALIFEELGNLMNQSHESCRDLYDCSCEELDQLVQICRKSGAFGSRLTGAGWGGCVVSLIPKDNLESFLKSVKEKYYDKNERLKNLFTESAFSTKPSDGISIILP